MGRGEYCRPADLVVDNRSDLVKVVAAPVVGQRTYRDARGPIYDVSVADVRQAGHVDWPGSSSANDTSIPKPSEYLFDRRLYLYGETFRYGISLRFDTSTSIFDADALVRVSVSRFASIPLVSSRGSSIPIPSA